MVTTATPPMAIVEIDGLHFKICKHRGRRSTRGAMTLTRLFGAGVLALIVGTKFEALDDRAKLETMGRIIAQSKFTGGTATDPDEFEAGVTEVAHWTKASGGQGVCYSTDGDEGPWLKITDMGTLDPYDAVDWSTWLMILWEVIKLNYRPTTAGSGIGAGTSPADTTATEGSKSLAARSGVQLS